MEIENNELVQIPQKKEKQMFLVWISIGISIILLVIMFALMFTTVDPRKPLYSNYEPTIEIESTINSLIFNVQSPKRNCKYVIFEVQLYDNDNTFVKSFTMRTDNIKKGELKQLQYKFSLGEMFETQFVKVQISEYK